MCMTMCMLNSTRPQIPGALQVAQTNSAQPSTQQMVRPTGQASPRRRSRTTPARYSPTARTAVPTKSQSMRHAVSQSASVIGPGSG